MSHSLSSSSPRKQRRHLPHRSASTGAVAALTHRCASRRSGGMPVRYRHARHGRMRRKRPLEARRTCQCGPLSMPLHGSRRRTARIVGGVVLTCMDTSEHRRLRRRLRPLHRSQRALLARPIGCSRPRLGAADAKSRRMASAAHRGGKQKPASSRSPPPPTIRDARTAPGLGAAHAEPRRIATSAPWRLHRRPLARRGFLVSPSSPPPAW